MDAMDVFGSLLGRKSKSGSPGGNILKDILGGGKSSSPRRPAPTQHSRPPRSTGRPQTIDDAAKSLEEMLNVSDDRRQQRQPPKSSGSTAAPPSSGDPQRTRFPSPSPREMETLNEQSKVLIRTMIGAAKADGQLTESEQQKIISELGNLSAEEADFLRTEFRRPADAKQLAWEIPIGMEEQAYTMALIAIDLDQNKEADFLADLAHGLRISPKSCNAIHGKHGAPAIYKL